MEPREDQTPLADSGTVGSIGHTHGSVQTHTSQEPPDRGHDIKQREPDLVPPPAHDRQTAEHDQVANTAEHHQLDTTVLVTQRRPVSNR